VRRSRSQAFFTLITCAAVLGAASVLVTVPIADAALADDQFVDAANRAFEKAAAQDPVALEMQTDPSFTWIDATGTLQSRREILDRFSLGSAPQLTVLTTAVGVQLTTRVYGQLAFVQVHAGRSYSLRIFAKRNDGWRAVHVIELTQPPQGAAPASKTGAAVPSEEGVITECVNPCSIVPFKPVTPAARAAFADWREMELGSLTRNMEQWGRHVLEDVLIVDSGGNGTISKAQRIANTLRQKRAGVRTNEVPPVLWADAYDFGGAVLLLMLQQPYKGQPYYGTRIYVNRDGRYQMALSYHTSIASVPDFSLSKQLPAPPAK
jgi:Domain of unknown function (DUF4440)